MAAAPPEIRTYSVIVLFLGLAVIPGAVLAAFLIVGVASRPVDVIFGPVPSALAFGAAVAGVFGILQLVRARKIARSLGYELPLLQLPSPRQVVEVIVGADAGRTRAAALTSLRDLNPRATVTGANADALSTTTGLGWSSWGEQVEVLVRPIDSQRTLLVVSSRPVLFTNFIDLGRNLENVGRVVSRVEHAIAAPPATR